MELGYACVFSFPNLQESIAGSLFNRQWTPTENQLGPSRCCTVGCIFPASESEESCWTCKLRGFLCAAATSPPGNAVPLSPWDGSSPTRGYFSSLVGIARILSLEWGFPGGSDSTQSVCSAGDPGSIPGSGRSPGEGNGNPLQYCCLENPMDREAWWATVKHGSAKSQTWLSD